AYTQYQLYRYHTDSFRQALTNTATFGPWLHDTQHFVTDMVLDIWDALDEQTRKQSLTALERALQSRPEKIKKLIEAKQGWNTLCNAVYINSKAKKHSYPNITNNCHQPN
ncbi:MAG: hypothetical protein HKO71_07305, partial [Pseudomonadales bacterium]|nr:hypothetical protein [Pseudomonadales bacterium]